MVIVLVSVVGGVFIVFALMALCYRSVVVHRNLSLCLRLVEIFTCLPFQVCRWLVSIYCTCIYIYIYISININRRTSCVVVFLTDLTLITCPFRFLRSVHSNSLLYAALSLFFFAHQKKQNKPYPKVSFLLLQALLICLLCPYFFNRGIQTLMMSCQRFRMNAINRTHGC